MDLGNMHYVDSPIIPDCHWKWGWVNLVAIPNVIMRNMATSVVQMYLSHPVHRVW